MEAFVQQVLIGLSNGALIAIVALGYTLVYGILQLINFAHGDVFMTGGMMALTGVVVFGLSPERGTSWVALALVMAACVVWCAALNVGVDQVGYRPLRSSNRLVPLISAIGMSFILTNIGGYWGTALMHGSADGWSKLSFPSFVGNVDVLHDWLGLHTHVTFSLKQGFVIAVAVPLMVGLEFFVHRTRLGRAMRATGQNPEAAALMGVNVQGTIALAFLIGGGLAGAAGFVYALYQNEVFFNLGFVQGLYAFTAAVLGGIGNLAGAALGGVVIGLVSSLTQYYLAPDLAPVAVFLTLILVITIRPGGMLGSPVAEKV